MGDGRFKKGYDPRRQSAIKFRTGEAFRELCREKTPAALELIEQAMLDEDENKRIRLECARYIIEQGYGRPASSVQLSQEAGRNVEAMPLEQLDAAIARFLGAEKDITPREIELPALAEIDPPGGS